MADLSLEVFLERVGRIGRFYKWRYGQALFNSLEVVRPLLAEQIRGTMMDPFHKELDDISPDLWIWLADNWSAVEELPESRYDQTTERHIDGEQD